MDGARLPSMTGAVAMSWDKSVALPVYGYRPLIGLDLSGLDDAASWDMVQLVARDQMGANRGPPAGLQPAWLDAYRRPSSGDDRDTGSDPGSRKPCQRRAQKCADSLGWMQPDPQLPTAPVTIEAK